MHMADALLSPAVGGAMWAATAGVTLYSARKMRRDLDERRVPLMGVLGAFVFAAQMINFTIPGTGSSGHLGGGLLLAILLGPPAAFITIASILTVQALFFADGGLLALGCNAINMGLIPCFVVYPLLYRPMVRKKPTSGRLALGTTVGAVVGLQLGALGVVVEAMLSGASDLPLTKFLLLMQPIHLAIGLVEGLVTATVVGFVWKARPEVLELSAIPVGVQRGFRPVVMGFLIAAVVMGGLLSWFASTHPDGLEWAITRSTGREGVPQFRDPVHNTAKYVQEKTAVLPDYDFAGRQQPATAAADGKGAGSAWGTPSGGTSLAGIAGGAASLMLAAGIAWVFRPRKAADSTTV